MARKPAARPGTPGKAIESRPATPAKAIEPEAALPTEAAPPDATAESPGATATAGPMAAEPAETDEATVGAASATPTATDTTTAARAGRTAAGAESRPAVKSGKAWRADRKRPRRFERLRRNALVRHMMALLPIFLIFAALAGAYVLWMTYGPYAPKPTQGAVDPADKAALGPKYLLIVNTADASRSRAMDQILAMDGASNLAGEKAAWNDFYNSNAKFIKDIQAVDWRSASPIMGQAVDTLQQEQASVEKMRNASTLEALRGEFAGFSTQDDALTSLESLIRSYFGLPEATPTPLPVVPSETPGASGSGASPGASATPGASTTPGPSDSPGPSPSGSASSASPVASASATASGA